MSDTGCASSSLAATAVVRWGILGTGGIAHKFAEGLKGTNTGTLVAIGSRAKETAVAFGEKYGVLEERCHPSYALLAADPSVDAIYIATPHNLHATNALLCIGAGKSVLVEKPFAVNAKEAREVVSAAREKGVFCMEAMWSRFLPPLKRLCELVGLGGGTSVIGDVRMVTGDFGYRGDWEPEQRHLNPKLAGGALLDVGVYPINLACMLLGGKPVTVVGAAHIGDSGVDEQAGIVMMFDGGRMAVLSTAVRTDTPHEAWVMGTEGRIKLHAAWWRGGDMTVYKEQADEDGGDVGETISVSVDGNGYHYEAEEVARCLAAGRLESEHMTLDESVNIMEAMDQLRQQWGLVCPMD